MLTEPISITGNGSAESFQRISVDGRKALYNVAARTPGNECVLTIGHTDVGSGISRRTRTLVRIDDNIVLSDTVTPGVNSIQLVIDRPVSQAADTAVLEALAKLVNYLDTAGVGQAIIDGAI
jgi:hypothetical protein